MCGCCCKRVKPESKKCICGDRCHQGITQSSVTVQRLGEKRCVTDSGKRTGKIAGLKLTRLFSLPGKKLFEQIASFYCLSQPLHPDLSFLFGSKFPVNFRVFVQFI